MLVVNITCVKGEDADEEERVELSVLCSASASGDGDRVCWLKMRNVFGLACLDLRRVGSCDAYHEAVRAIDSRVWPPSMAHVRSEERIGSGRMSQRPGQRVVARPLLMADGIETLVEGGCCVKYS